MMYLLSAQVRVDWNAALTHTGTQTRRHTGKSEALGLNAESGHLSGRGGLLKSPPEMCRGWGSNQ